MQKKYDDGEEKSKVDIEIQKQREERGKKVIYRR
jgi:hypothetical protein